jgi:hypothetical protein
LLLQVVNGLDAFAGTKPGFDRQWQYESHTGCGIWMDASIVALFDGLAHPQGTSRPTPTLLHN